MKKKTKSSVAAAASASASSKTPVSSTPPTPTAGAPGNPSGGMTLHYLSAAPGFGGSYPYTRYVKYIITIYHIICHMHAHCLPSFGISLTRTKYDICACTEVQ
jgi:hypothetical protein